MPLCLVPDASGAVHTTQDAPASCTGYLAVTPQEYSNLAGSIWIPLSLADGAAISVAILSVWAVAWAFRPLSAAMSYQPDSSGD